MTNVCYGIAFPASRGVLSPPKTLLLQKIAAAATGAFALWKLSFSYAGACMRVRRASDGAEQDIGFAGFGLDAAALLAFCAASDGFVTKWYDQSGNGNDLAQATAANQPMIVASGALVATINGNPAIKIADSTDKLTGPNLTALISLSAYTLVSLSRVVTGGEGAGDTVGYNQKCVVAGSQGDIWHAYGATKILLGHYVGPAKEIAFTYSAPSTNVLVSRYDGVSVKGWQNGGAGSTLAAGSVAIDTDKFQLGRNDPGAISSAAPNLIAAVLAFNSGSVADADLDLIGADLASYGGVSWSAAS